MKNRILHSFAQHFCLLLMLGAWMSAEAQKKKPNLLFIITDQQRFDAMSSAGNTVLQTPNMDRLAQQGARFTNAYTPCAVCGPARSSILTGTTVENNGMKINEYAYNAPVAGNVMTMPTFDEILTNQGYHCEYYGKWHTRTSHSTVYKNPKTQDKKGKSFFGPEGQSYAYLEYLDSVMPKRMVQSGELYDKISDRPYRTNPLDKFYGKEYAEVVEKKLRSIQPDQHGELLMDKEYSITAFQGKQTLEALERLRDSTFSITVSFHSPHAPMLPPTAFYNIYPIKDMRVPVSISDDMKYSPYRRTNGRLDHTEYADPEKIKYMISSYYGLIKEIDDWVGKIMNKLDELGIAEETLVIFTSDHGEMLGAHGMREKNVFYEESAHVPLILRYPGKIKSNQVVQGYTSNVNLFATILDYLKAGSHPSDGESLRNWMEGKGRKQNRYVVQEWDYRGDTEPNYMVMKDGWKMMIPYSETSTVLNALYDLNTDPYEMNNLLSPVADKQKVAAKAEELRACLVDWLNKNKSSHLTGVRNRKLY